MKRQTMGRACPACSLAANFSTVLIIFSVAGPAHPATDIKTDGSVGASTQISAAPANTYVIPQSLGQVAGNNLFHSFQKFNVGSGDTARFTTNVTGNVISRVTGGTASLINGQIQLDAGGATPAFWFINPAGVVFGNGASINVPGAFHASTANYLKFSDGTRFYADPAATSSFSSAAPEAFGFLGSTSASISIQDGAYLDNGPNQVSIIASDVSITDSSIVTTSGDIRIVALGAKSADVPAYANLATNALGALTASNSYVESYGGSNYLDAGSISLDAADIMAYTPGGVGDAGNTRVRSSSLRLDNVSHLGSKARVWGGTGNAGTVDVDIAGDITVAGESLIMADTYNAGDGGSVLVRAENLYLDDYSWVSSDAVGQGGAGSFISGNGGFVFVDVTGMTRIRNGSWISADTYRNGNGGVVWVRTGSLLIDGNAADATKAGITSDSLSSYGGNGNGGTVLVQVAGLTEIYDGGRISTNTQTAGDAGVVVVESGRIVMHGHDDDTTGITSLANADSSGNAGNISVTVSGDISMAGSARISSTAKGIGSGNAGNIYVEAANLTIDGTGAAYDTGITSRTVSDFWGDAGTVIMNIAGHLKLLGRGIISTSTWSGDAGYIDVTAGDVTISGAGSGIFSNTNPAYSGLFDSGDAGAIAVQVANNLSLADGGQIATNTYGPGSAGAVAVHAKNIVINGVDSQIAAKADAGSSGQTGSIWVTADQALTLQNSGSITIQNDAVVAAPGGITSTDITISAPDITLKDASITARSTGNVAASNIDISFTNKLFIDPSVISTSAVDGNGGNINIAGGNVIWLDHSQITTSVTGSNGNGGNINLSGQFLVMNSGFIQANTAAALASGGDINLNIVALIPSNGSLVVGGSTPLVFNPFAAGPNVIQAAAPDGVSGNIAISSPVLDMSSSLSGINARVLKNAGLGRSPCSVASGSSLATIGRGGQPLSPFDAQRVEAVTGASLASTSQMPSLAQGSTTPFNASCLSG